MLLPLLNLLLLLLLLLLPLALLPLVQVCPDYVSLAVEHEYKWGQGGMVSSQGVYTCHAIWSSGVECWSPYWYEVHSPTSRVCMKFVNSSFYRVSHFMRLSVCLSMYPSPSCVQYIMSHITFSMSRKQKTKLVWPTNLLVD